MMLYVEWCDLGCKQVGLKSFVVSIDYRDYMGSSSKIWALRCLFLYLCSYNLVGSVTVSAPVSRRAREKRRKRSERACKEHLRAARLHTDARRGQGVRSSGGGATSHMADMPTPRIARWGNSPNRWRAIEWPTWEPILGHFRADSRHGPLMKFDAHEMLYIFCLRCKVIGVPELGYNYLQRMMCQCFNSD
jgi:hypothetical protein